MTDASRTRLEQGSAWAASIMHTFDKTAWEILNATADDCENLEQIYGQICRHVPNAPSVTKVADHIRGLVEQGLLAIVMDENGRPWQNDDLSYVWRGWFSMTSKGKSIWESSQQFAEQEQPDEHSRR